VTDEKEPVEAVCRDLIACGRKEGKNFIRFNQLLIISSDFSGLPLQAVRKVKTLKFARRSYT